MSKFGVELTIKDAFFDRQKVLDSERRDNLRRLSKAGAFLRTRARSKLRRRKKPAKPGQAPSVYSRDPRATLKFILFGLGEDDNSVLIGPVVLSGARLKSSSAETVPELMERGGTSEVDGQRARYAKHAFMGPTLDEEAKAGTLGEFWSK